MRPRVLRALLVALVCGFVTFTVCVSIAPLSHWTQETAACPGADRIERDVRDGGDVRSNGRTIGTTVFTLRCTDGDHVTLVENDEAVLKGFALAFLLGAVPGVVYYLVRSTLRVRSAA